MIKTARLILKNYTDQEREPFYSINCDPEVMRYFPTVLTREESDAMLKRLSDGINQRGWGLWGTFLDEELIGFIGIQPIPFEAHFTPAVEVGWRLAKKHWGKGYATEGALAAIEYGFDNLKLNEIVAFTTVHNLPSQKVMIRLGMTHDPKDDFDHPRLEENHPLRRHVLYRLRNPHVRS